MVINIGALNSGQNELVESDIKAVVDASGDKLVKVIIETCLLSYDEKVQACQLAKLAGADFVKTSTGFSTGGATIEDVELMREVVGPNMGGLKQLEEHVPIKMRKLLLKQGLIGLEHLRVLR